MKRGEVALAGAGFAGAFLRSVHLVQPHQGTRQLELAVPGVALQLESSASEWFGFGEAVVLREKRGQAEEGQGITALAEVDGFLEGFLGLRRPAQAHVDQAHLVVGLVVGGEFSHSTLEKGQGSGGVLLRPTLATLLERFTGFGRESRVPHGNYVTRLARNR